MLFLAKRRSGSAWEDATSLPKERHRRDTVAHAPRPAAWWDPDPSSWTAWENWQDTDWPPGAWEGTWEGKTKHRKVEEATTDQNPKKIRKKSSKELDESVGSDSAVLGQSTLPKPSLPPLPAGMRFSGVVNAIEPKSGNLLIDCPTISQVFGRPPSIKPEENRMNARVGSMVIFGLLPGETPVATDVVINGFDSEIGLRPDPVQNDNCDVAGLLPGKGKKGMDSYKGKAWGGKSGKANAKGSLKGLQSGKGRGKASALSHAHPWRT